jgi:pyruvate/2-oxoglutarate dehydrogenase complex dihydrolipoamide acyltransferase (E2) component
MSETGDYDVGRFTKAREMITDAVNASKYYNHIIGLIEVDVTKGLIILSKHREKTGERLSFTSWIMKCVAQAVSENLVVQTFRKGRRKTIAFKDVDIKCLVEKDMGGGKKVPIAYVVRKSNEKSYKEINDEIRDAQKYKEDTRGEEQKIKKRQQMLMKIPTFLRRGIIWRNIMNNPFKIKQHMGTVGVTAVGMFGRGISGWAIPKTMHSTTFALGAIVKKPCIIDGKIEHRDILHITAEFNHDVVDGAPAARCIARLTEIIKEGFGLEDFM